MADRENMRKWVDALRSGKYMQGTGRLACNGKFCCLGVATELAIADGVNIKKYADPNGTVHYDHLISLPPYSVDRWLGSDGTPYVDYTDPDTGDTYPVSVVWLNDNAGWSFNQIADALEAEYLVEVAA